MISRLKPWAVPGAFLALAILWTWPAAITPDAVGRHSDALGTIWFIDAAPRLEGRFDPLSGWPAGATYGRPDSFTLWGLAWLLRWLPPVRLHAWLAILGLAASAWAAEGFARALGARRPWSLLAGVAFAFCGLAGTALLEGYVYHLVDPWLPLMAWSWWRATGPEGRWLDGVAAGATFLLALLTTAYLGVAAAVIVAAIGLGRLERPLRWRPPLAAAAVAAPGILAYLWAFQSAPGDHGFALSGGPLLEQVGHSLVRMAGPTVETDLSGVSQSPALLGVLPGLVLVAPACLRRLRGWQPVALAGLIALILSFMPRFDAALLLGLPPGLRGVADALSAPLMRFPDRMAWGWQLCGGAVGACALTALGERAPRRALALLIAAFAEPFLISQVPWRQGAADPSAPAAYAAHAGPVLDYWPEDVFPAPRWYLRSTNTGCFYQVFHQRPIADHCIFTPGIPSPRETLTRWMTPRLLALQVGEVQEKLGELGFGSVVLHVDPFREPERTTLTAALRQMDPSPVRSTDGGEHVLAFAVPAAPGADPKAAWEAWTAAPKEP